jgi:hypothetical protein
MAAQHHEGSPSQLSWALKMAKMGSSMSGVFYTIKKEMAT